jgi:hypothetical protein
MWQLPSDNGGLGLIFLEYSIRWLDKRLFLQQHILLEDVFAVTTISRCRAIETVASLCNAGKRISKR